MSANTNPTASYLRDQLRAASAESPTSAATAALRLSLLRALVPEAVVQIDAVRADDAAIAVRATIGRGGGGRASAIAAIDVVEGSSWSDQMAQVEADAIARALDLLGMTLERAMGSESLAAEYKAPATPTEAPSADEGAMATYSWNAFWQHARSRNITREQVESALGRSVKEVSPHDAVDALTAAGLWQA